MKARNVLYSGGIFVRLATLCVAMMSALCLYNTAWSETLASPDTLSYIADLGTKNESLACAREDSSRLEAWFDMRSKCAAVSKMTVTDLEELARIAPPEAKINMEPCRPMVGTLSPEKRFTIAVPEKKESRAADTLKQ